MVVKSPGLGKSATLRPARRLLPTLLPIMALVLFHYGSE